MDCSFNVTLPTPGRGRVVFGAGLRRIGRPATCRPTNVDMLLLETSVAVAVLSATAFALVAVINPPIIFTFWTSALAWTVATADVRFVVALSMTGPVLVKTPGCVETAEAVTVLFERAQPRDAR